MEGFLRATRGKGALENILASLRARTAKKSLPASDQLASILDLGCGSYPVFLSQVSAALKVGLDQASGESWTPQPAGIQLVIADLEKAEGLPFRDETFEVVTMLAVAEHLNPESLSRTLHEAKRILRLGGVLVITTPPPWTDRLLKLMVPLGLISSVESDEHEKTYTARTLSELLEGVFGPGSTRARYFELGLNVIAVAENRSPKQKTPGSPSSGQKNGGV